MILSSAILVMCLAFARAEYTGKFCFSRYIRYGYYLPNKSTFVEGDVVRYHCGSGYKLIGEQLLTCVGDEWDHDVPTCKRVRKCRRPYHVPYGYIEPPNVYEFESGAQIWYKCEINYGPDGYAENKCLDNGKWLHPSPSCVPLFCVLPHLSEYLNYEPYKDRYEINDIVEYSCKDGYELKGSPESKCLKGGKWTTPPPTCGAGCHPLPYPFNGYYTPRRSSYRPGQLIQFYCYGNLAIKGQQTLKCTDYGVWSHYPPTCDVPVCYPPSRPQYGTFYPHRSSYKIGEEIHFKCGLGYKLEGRKTLRCESNGKWSYYIPTCAVPHCPPLKKPIGGYFTPVQERYYKDDPVWFKCFPPLKLVGKPDIICKPGGYWSYPEPTCETPQCPPPPNIYYGSYQPIQQIYPVGITVHYQCDHYYAVSGQAEITCKPGGHWSHRYPTCERGCRRPEIPKAGYVHPFQETYAVNQPVWIKCIKGYRPNKDSDIVCRGNDIWEPSDHGVTCVTEGSCKNKCGKRDTGTLCRCDDYCHTEHQCCSDYVELCFGNNYYH